MIKRKGKALAKKPAVKRETTATILKRLEASVKRLEKRQKELEDRLTKIDLGEVTEMNDKLNKSQEQRARE